MAPAKEPPHVRTRIAPRTGRPPRGARGAYGSQQVRHRARGADRTHRRYRRSGGRQTAADRKPFSRREIYSPRTTDRTLWNGKLNSRPRRRGISRSSIAQSGNVYLDSSTSASLQSTHGRSSANSGNTASATPGSYVRSKITQSVSSSRNRDAGAPSTADRHRVVRLNFLEPPPWAAIGSSPD